MTRVCIFARGCQKYGSEIVQYEVSIVRCKDKFCKIRYSTFKHTVFLDQCGYFFQGEKTAV